VSLIRLAISALAGEFVALTAAQPVGVSNVEELLVTGAPLVTWFLARSARGGI
jgi:hypothetical protein